MPSTSIVKSQARPSMRSTRSSPRLGSQLMRCSMMSPRVMAGKYSAACTSAVSEISPAAVDSALRALDGSMTANRLPSQGSRTSRTRGMDGSRGRTHDPVTVQRWGFPLVGRFPSQAFPRRGISPVGGFPIMRQTLAHLLANGCQKRRKTGNHRPAGKAVAWLQQAGFRLPRRPAPSAGADPFVPAPPPAYGTGPQRASEALS